MDKEGLLNVSRRSPIRSQRSMTEKDKEILISKYFFTIQGTNKKAKRWLTQCKSSCFLMKKRSMTEKDEEILISKYFFAIQGTNKKAKRWLTQCKSSCFFMKKRSIAKKDEEIYSLPVQQ